MQLNPGTLRQKIRRAPHAERPRLITALFLRDAALLAFAIGYISLFALLLGSANSYVGVTSFCILLSVRFVNFDYNPTASLGTLAVVFGLMGLNGWLLPQLAPVAAWGVNALSIALILRLTTHQPLYGNGGVYTFSYLLVTNVAAPLPARLAALGLALIICSLVFLKHHRHQHVTISWWQVVKLTGCHEPTWHWQVRLATGVATALLAGQLLHVQRVMWLGFACMSVLLPTTDQVRSRSVLRFSGVVVGSLLFSGCVDLLPTPLVGLLAPLAGFGLGLTPNYFLASIFNCFGALSIAHTLFGLVPATELRIFNNGVGILIAIGFAGLFHWHEQRQPPVNGPSAP